MNMFTFEILIIMTSSIPVLRTKRIKTEQARDYSKMGNSIVRIKT